MVREPTARGSRRRPRARRACAGRRPAGPGPRPTCAPDGGGHEQLAEDRHAVAGDLRRRGRRRPGRRASRGPCRPSSAASPRSRASAAARSAVVGRQEGDARRRTRPASGSVEVDDLAQERVGDLGEDARAVTDERVGAGGAAVVEVAQGGQGVVDDVVPGAAAHRGDEGDAAGVVLVLAAVEPAGLRAGRRREREPRGCTVLESRERPASGTRGGRHWPAWSEQDSACPGVLPDGTAESDLLRRLVLRCRPPTRARHRPATRRRPARQNP